MKATARNLSILFAAGCLGGLVNSLTAWVAGKYGITAIFDVSIAPRLTAGWLYPRIVWGGIWGALFLIPLFKGKTIGRGLFMSIGPTVVQLFIIFPHFANKGVMGLALGTFTPLFVIIFNAAWGITAAFWVKFARS
ncbi:MAG: hypothetical protein OEV42_16630 [Deltaproteobacteria bacterium]|nr:hypothetical protein [Deltaproteobacteria bacterium]